MYSSLHTRDTQLAELHAALETHLRCVVWPMELALETYNPRFVAWPLELGLGTHNPHFGVAP